MSPTQDLVIGLDCSTTACKAIAWNRTGQPVAEGRATYPLYNPQPQWFEQRADEWWDALVVALRDLGTKINCDRVAALSITNQRETFVPVDASGEPIRNALVWNDTRALAELERMDQLVGHDAIRDITGKGATVTNGLPKIMWLYANEPDCIARTHKFLDVHAYLAYRMTGRFATSLTCADPVGLVDMRRGEWATEMLATLGVEAHKLPEIVPTGNVIGALTTQAADALGLPAGIPVVAGAGDGQSAGLGANITAPNRAYMNLGTAVVTGAYADHYVTNRAFRTLFSPVGNAYVPESVLISGTFMVSWFVAQFGPDLQGLHLPLSAEEVLEAAAAKVPPGALGLMLVPYWQGVGAPYWDPNARGITVGWTPAHRREHFYRALLEGIAFEERLTLDSISAATGEPIDDMILMGGGARSALWCQIVADVTGRTVRRAGSPEATNLGAGILAAAAAGWYPGIREAAAGMTSVGRTFTPDPANVEVYARLFEVYRELYPTLQPQLNRLSRLTASASG